MYCILCSGGGSNLYKYVTLYVVYKFVYCISVLKKNKNKNKNSIA